MKLDNAAEEITIPFLAYQGNLKVDTNAKDVKKILQYFYFNSCSVVFHNH